MPNYRPNLLQETYRRKAEVEAKIVALKQELESVGREKAQALADVAEAHSKLLAIEEAFGGLEEAVVSYVLEVTKAQSAADDLLKTTVDLIGGARDVLAAVEAKAVTVVSDLESKGKEVAAKTKAIEDRTWEVERKERDLEVYRGRIEKLAQLVGIKVIL